jgi:hypothetical protein
MDPRENDSLDEWKLEFVCPPEIQEKLVAPFAEFIRRTFRQGHVIPRPGPVQVSQDLAAMEKRIIAALTGRKPEAQSPFLKRKEAIQLLKTRSTLERCERAGWIKATIRKPRLVLYRRTDVMACVYRISQGEYREIGREALARGAVDLVLTLIPSEVIFLAKEDVASSSLVTRSP